MRGNSSPVEEKPVASRIGPSEPYQVLDCDWMSVTVEAAGFQQGAYM